MVRIRNQLQYIPFETKNVAFQEIEKKVIEYIEQYCSHKIIQDLIDISPEYSKTIYYCELCEMDFTNKK